MAVMSAVIDISDTDWALVEDLFDPARREGKPARYPRRDVVDAILFLACTGRQWRYLPACYPPWEAVWQTTAALARQRHLGEGDDDERHEAEHRHRNPRAAARGSGRFGQATRRALRPRVAHEDAASHGNREGDRRR